MSEHAGIFWDSVEEGISSLLLLKISMRSYVGAERNGEGMA
jgi:hypothetical protein